MKLMQVKHKLVWIIEVRAMNNIKPRLMSVKETASYLGISPKTIRNRLGRKAVKPFPVTPKRIGRRVLFDVRDLDAYIKELPKNQGGGGLYFCG